MGRANPDKAEEVSAFFGRVFVPIARDYGCAVLVLHHLRKPSGSDDSGSLQHKVRGSSDLPAAVGSVLVLDRNGETRTLWQTKCRWQPEQPPGRNPDRGRRTTASGSLSRRRCRRRGPDPQQPRRCRTGRDAAARSCATCWPSTGVRDTDKAATRTLGRSEA